MKWGWGSELLLLVVRILHWLEMMFQWRASPPACPLVRQKLLYLDTQPSPQRPRYSGLRSRGVRDAYYLRWYQHCNASRYPRRFPIHKPSNRSRSIVVCFLVSLNSRSNPVVPRTVSLMSCACLMFSHFFLHRLSILISMTEYINDCIYIETLHFYPSTYISNRIHHFLCIYIPTSFH